MGRVRLTRLHLHILSIAGVHLWEDHTLQHPDLQMGSLERQTSPWTWSAPTVIKKRYPQLWDKTKAQTIIAWSEQSVQWCLRCSLKFQFQIKWVCRNLSGQKSICEGSLAYLSRWLKLVCSPSSSKVWRWYSSSAQRIQKVARNRYRSSCFSKSSKKSLREKTSWS